jgi:Asp/Glu/hydantoin racemase
VTGPILVVNPNSNAAVTAGIDAAAAPFRLGGGPAIDCVTLAEGPFGIESQRDSDAVIPHLVRLVAERADASAFVIACYSDPGVDACREATAAPVFGIQECGVAAALARADRFGVIALSEGSIRRHRWRLRRLGLLERLVGERAARLDVADSASAAAFEALRAAGAALVAEGADALVLGCAGMARHRAGLERALGVAVVDPVQAGVAAALGAVLAGR